jgi:D-proline reductase (dithiol) PrdB
MAVFTRMKNRIIAKAITRFPRLARGFINAYTPGESTDIPWAPVRKSLKESTVALVTTAGVHRRDQTPFDMQDRNGDPTYREIAGTAHADELMITHDYYDHSDADKDINIVFPIERLREYADEGIIGRVAPSHYSFMGHILGEHITTLTRASALDVAARLKRERADCVLLTPG